MKKNTIFDEDKEMRIKAINTIDSTTKARKEKGWLFVHHRVNNSTKQIHPDNLQKALAEGWRIKKGYQKDIDKL